MGVVMTSDILSPSKTCNLALKGLKLIFILLIHFQFLNLFHFIIQEMNFGQRSIEAVDADLLDVTVHLNRRNEIAVASLFTDNNITFLEEAGVTVFHHLSCL